MRREQAVGSLLVVVESPGDTGLFGQDSQKDLS